MMSTYPKVVYTLGMDLVMFALSITLLTLMFNDKDFQAWGMLSHSQQDDEKLPMPSTVDFINIIATVYSGLLWI